MRVANGGFSRAPAPTSPGSARPGGRGGPDRFGYGWVDSDTPGGPVFDWVDITPVGIPVPLNGDDITAGPFPVGFSFPSYGGDFEEFYICTNGFISFTSTSRTASSRPLPNMYAPENLVAPFWEDLDFGAAQCAYMHNDGSRRIIQYEGVSHYESGGLDDPRVANAFSVRDDAASNGPANGLRRFAVRRGPAGGRAWACLEAATDHSAGGGAPGGRLGSARAAKIFCDSDRLPGFDFGSVEECTSRR